jgi:hypothetical protein
MEKNGSIFFARILASFIAGFMATLIFHQSALAEFCYAGLAPIPPFPC